MANSTEADRHPALKEALPPVHRQNDDSQSSPNGLVPPEDHESTEYRNTNVGFQSKQVGMNLIYEYSVARSCHSRQKLFLESISQRCRLT